MLCKLSLNNFNYTRDAKAISYAIITNRRKFGRSHGIAKRQHEDYLFLVVEDDVEISLGSGQVVLVRPLDPDVAERLESIDQNLQIEMILS